MISVTGVSMRFGSKVLFEDVATTFSAGRRYGLTGPNGAGKSTFMKLLTGETQPQRGTVARPRKLGVLRQDHYAFDRFRVIDTVVMGNERLWTALQERDVLYAKADMTEADGMRLGELEGIVGEEDGYSAESDAAVLLQGLDIPNHLHERPMSELQGGQKVRVLLAQALYGNPEALLLDEQLDLGEAARVREAVYSLIDDLERGRALQSRDPTANTFTWRSDAGRAFRYVRQLQKHEESLIAEMQRYGTLVNALTDPSLQHPFSVELEQRVKKLRRATEPLTADAAEAQKREVLDRYAAAVSESFAARLKELGEYGFVFQEVAQGVGGSLYFVTPKSGDPRFDPITAAMHKIKPLGV